MAGWNQRADVGADGRIERSDGAASVRRGQCIGGGERGGQCGDGLGATGATGDAAVRAIRCRARYRRSRRCRPRKRRREVLRRLQVVGCEWAAPGGLQVAPNTSDPNVWQGASLPSQSSNGGQTMVTVVQNTQKAILTWSSFNIGTNTTLYFNQSAGNASDGTNKLDRAESDHRSRASRRARSWAQIKAEGSVYLINNNGIIFGGSSQIDVHTLIASFARIPG